MIDTGIVDAPAEDRLPSVQVGQCWWAIVGGTGEEVGNQFAGRDRNRPGRGRITTILGAAPTRDTGGMSRTAGTRVTGERNRRTGKV